ncbi:glucosyl-3-phosphoglycerate synthase [Patulibacter minatonensis]|uniref:glucosyl-3-phosphoglycerate synthase n=1 Tax=Patulibacter minatonensis TaxID=298163 RepID=UPI000688C6E0|nr:glucosyl-3-phosphoglycerate synthase [Patulibacter minatonensis]
MSPLRAVVVVPARNEQERIGPSVDALVAQAREIGPCFGVVVVDDASTDSTAREARAAAHRARSERVEVRVIAGPGAGVGWARRTGLETAAAWLRRTNTSAGLRDAKRAPGLLVTTDADTRPAPGWLAALLRAADDGHAVIAGDVHIDPNTPLDDELARRRTMGAEVRLRAVRETDGPDAAHHHFSAANLALTADAFDACGGMPTPRALEDEALLQTVRDADLEVHRTTEAVVYTSPRTTGRAPRGLAADLALEVWRGRHRHHHREFRLDRLAAAVRATGTRVVVVIPAKEVATTIGSVLEVTVAPLVDAGIVQEVVVIDAASADGTAVTAEAHGARVVQQDTIAREHGPCRGKGDAMWRAIQCTTGDVIAFLDGDTEDPSSAHLAGILGPLLTDDDIAMVRGCFDRPRRQGDGSVIAHEGGRVTELTARPLLNLHRPLLAGFRQPLAGEFAARRTLLERLPFPVGYGVEIATLVDALDAVGLGALAEVDLGVRQNRHQPLRDLAPMAFAVLVALERRLGRDTIVSSSMRLPWNDDLPHAVPVAERPPVAELAARTGRPGRVLRNPDPSELAS